MSHGRAGAPELKDSLGATPDALADVLRRRGVSRRAFLNYCSLLGALMALPPALVPRLAHALEGARRPSVIWLSFQECTGCTESLTRSHAPSVEDLIFQSISLDYHHTLQAASGAAAEAAREHAMKENAGKYLVVVDGSIPLANPGYSTIAGISNKDMLLDTARGAAAILAVGTCASYGGLPKADPNPTGAVAVADLITGKPVINIPGCPPIPVVITGVVAHFLAFGLPGLDDLGRPLAFFGERIHDRCYRRPFYDRGLFAHGFDDDGARKGWCLYKVGCKGPVAFNACATVKWNAGVSFPIEAGHPCLGCSQPDFWDGGDFYQTLAIPTENVAGLAMGAMAVGAGAGAAVSALNTAKRKTAKKAHETVTIENLEKPKEKAET